MGTKAAPKKKLTPANKAKVAQQRKKSNEAQEKKKVRNAEARQRAKERKEAQKEKQQEINQRKKERASVRRAKEAERRKQLQLRRAVSKKIRDSKPKRAMSAYSLFIKNHLSTLKDRGQESLRAAFKDAAQKWKAMSEEQKRPFATAATAEKARAAKERQEYETKFPKNINQYGLFMKEKSPLVMKENPKMPLAEVAKKVSAQWKELSAKQKESYENKAKAHNAKVKANKEKLASAIVKDLESSK